MRECGSSGEDVSVNAVIILRNCGTISSNMRSTEEGIAPQFEFYQYLLLLLNFLSCASPMESLRSLRLRWQDRLGEGVCECSTSLETGVESVETQE